jgi:hypothetical protein
MASTRDRNTPGNYRMEQNINNSHVGWSTAAHEVAAYHPGDGLGAAKTARTALATNACDIESQLFGIGSSNLENPQPIVVPQLARLKSLAVFDKPKVALPEPLNVDTRNRPMFLN